MQYYASLVCIMENSLSIALVISFIATVGVFGVRKIQVKVFDIRKVLAHLIVIRWAKTLRMSDVIRF